MAAAQKEPSEPAVKNLFAMSCNKCFFTRCDEDLTSPDWKRANGEVAHIKGDKPGSARYDASQSDEERQGYYNLMLLCPKHHKLVDYLEPQNYSVEILLEMKEKHLEGCKGSSWAPNEAQLENFARFAIQEWHVLQARLPGPHSQTIEMPGPVESVAQVPSGTVSVELNPLTAEARGEAGSPAVETDDDEAS